MKLYIAEISFQDKDKYREILNSVSDERRKKTLSYKIFEDRYRSAAAGYLAEKYAGGNIIVDENGKPKSDRCFFNISHSGKYVIVAVSDKECGCDIEKTDENVNFGRISERFFTESENEYIDFARERFFEIWTLKESYLKCIGTGFHKPLNGFSVKFEEEREDGKKIFSVSQNDFECRFSLVNFFFDNYEISVCEKSDDLTVDIERVIL